ncbi:MAG: response regulator transcription factor [Candidatus Atribacteria bacterium]|nr:response regulator transcription factor [Candidatus Atribacteria bacterium]
MKKIRLMLVDDHLVVRVGLKTFLQTQEDFDVVAEASDGEEAVSRALEMHPDVILMDITMPGVDGLEATRRLRVLCPKCLILALTVHDDKQYFMQMLAAGASGYITKQAAGDDLIAAIHTIFAGNVFLQPALARWLLEDYQRLVRQPATQPSVLTEVDEANVIGLDVLSLRERQVLELVANGLNNQQIGQQLALSPKTIARHRERIMHKLNMHSRTELVKFAIRTGLVQLH